MKTKNKYQSGFTIIELMIATAVFSVVLILCTTGMIQIGRMYYKGVISTRTQEAARSIIEEVSRSIQFGGGQVILPSGTNPDRFCIDDQRYSFVTGKQVTDGAPTPTQTRNALVVDSDPSCSIASPPIDSAVYSLPANSRQLVPVNMRLARLSIEDKGDGLYKITVRIAHGDDDLLNVSQDECIGLNVATQFCAISELTTTVKKRI